jgi:hypothetical protein
MASVALTAVVLPAGTGPDGRLRAAVYLAPRLSGASSLDAFPDWVNWPALISQHGLTLTLACGANSATVAADPGPLRPDIWPAVFPPGSVVGSYPQPGYSQRLVVSYPARDAHAYLKYAYQAAAVSVLGGQQRLLERLLEPLMFRDGTTSTLDTVLSELRVSLWQAQQGTGIAAAPGSPPPTAAPAPASPLTPPADTQQMIGQFALYQQMPAAPGRTALPSTAAEFAQLIDFHKALSVLAAHPAVLTALGLVLPVSLPAGLCPDSPAAGAYGTLTVTGLTPGWQWSDPPDLAPVATAYVRAGSSFAAAPATDPAVLTAGSVAAGDVVDGFLALDPAAFSLAGVDIDGALLKAMSLADSVAFAESTPTSSTIEPVLAALRSGGISLLADGRGQQLLAALKDNESFEAALAGGAAPHPFSARDLLRGYRLDVWSARAGRWLSLHRRDGSYQFGDGDAVELPVADEEGFTQLAVMQPAADPTRAPDPAASAAGAPQPGTDLYVNERVARWNGWSLSAPRPGTPLNRSPDPALAADSDPASAAVTPFAMASTFTPHPGSLPTLRFGDRYRVRVRAVDLAGQSLPADAAPDPRFVLPGPDTALPHLRYEPVNPPVLVERVLPGPGGSNAQLVIRSWNGHPSLDTAGTPQTDERHVAPPRAAVQLVEQHGLLDDSSGRLRGDAATYATVVSRDRGQFAAVGNTPLEPGEQLTVPYFPDPLARGAVLSGLPHVPAGTAATAGDGPLAYQAPPDVVPLAGSVTSVSFGPDWPARQPFRIRLADGSGPPSWLDTERVLVVPLAKAETATVPLSCFAGPADLELLGVWGWVRELYGDLQAAALAQGGAGAALVNLAEEFALLTRLTLAGGHPLITPALSVTLVHAVQQPLGRPSWLRLPIVHDPASPAAVPSVENDFWAVTAWRYAGSQATVLLGALSVNGASTAAVDVSATWTEWVDDPAQPGPTRTPGAGAVDRIQLGPLDDGPVFSDGSQARMVAVYLSEVDALWFAAPFDQLAGATAPGQVAAPVHQHGDTKHRCISYLATASSGFQEYFAGSPGLDFTRTSDPVVVDVPSSARPAAPDVRYVVPTFGWERQESSNLKTEVRFGNGLRVYLGRPWFSSGEGELLGVVLWPQETGQPAPGDADREAAKEIITQWGLDPLWGGGTLTAVPAVSDLPGALRSATALTLEESAQLVDVAGHSVGYDPQRRLWYCDIEFANVTAYMPFVRLALARYQPSSIAGVELSHVVLADFAQLAPDRSASFVLDPAAPAQARLVIGGLAPAGPTQPTVTVTVESRVPEVGADLGWTQAPPTAATVTEDTPAPAQPAAVLWSGTVAFAAVPAAGQYRVVVREFESFQPVPAGPPATRLVYATALPFDFPATP